MQTDKILSVYETLETVYLKCFCFLRHQTFDIINVMNLAVGLFLHFNDFHAMNAGVDPKLKT